MPLTDNVSEDMETVDITSLLATAFETASAHHKELSQRWTSLSIRFGASVADILIWRIQQVGRLDILLRQLEHERLKSQQAGELNEPFLTSTTWQSMLSEFWVLAIYEVVRTAKEQWKKRKNEMPVALPRLLRQLELVRVPIAKGEIQGMNRKRHQKSPVMLLRAGGEQPKPYKNDGGYFAPPRFCSETGAILWLPADMENQQTAIICRRDLSDAMLALFD